MLAFWLVADPRRTGGAADLGRTDCVGGDMSSAVKPDWEGFGRDLMQDWPVGDVDGSELFEAALRNGLLREIPGGYDPEQHIDAEGICPETGDPWYEYAFGGARTPDPRIVELETKLAEEQRISTMRGNMIEFDLTPALSDAQAKLAEVIEGEGCARAVRLVFSNADATPKNVALDVALDAVPHIMDWYGAFFAGDRYTVTVDGRNVAMDINGGMVA